MNTKTMTPVTERSDHHASSTSGARKSTAETAQAAVSAETDRYLTFQLGSELYALPILKVTEIMEFRALTTIPMTPPFIRGVINLRGRVVPVLDLTTRFEQGSTQVARRSSIIIVDTDPEANPEARGHHAGILVDAVNKVLHLDHNDIEPPPSFGSGIHSDVVSGMARHNGEFIVVLDVNRIMSIDELVAFSQSLSPSPAPAKEAPATVSTTR